MQKIWLNLDTIEFWRDNLETKEQMIEELKKSIKEEKQYLKKLDNPKYIAKLVVKTKENTQAFINILESKLKELEDGNKRAED